MTVPTENARPVMAWVPVRDGHGRVRMEALWLPDADTPAQVAAGHAA